MPYALINNENMTVAIVARTAKAADIWSHFLCGMDDNVILTLGERKGFSCFTDLELQMLYYNLTRVELTVESYSDKLKSVYETICGLPVDDTDTDILEKRFLAPPEDFSAEPVVDKPRRWDTKDHQFVSTVKAGPKKQRSSTSSSSEKPSKPRGGTTARVWEIGDAVLAEFTDGDILDENDKKLVRKKIIEQCEAEGINSSTAGTQYSKWKRDRFSCS